jgi:hypothetical protein
MIQSPLTYGLSANIEKGSVNKHGVQYFAYVIHKIKTNLDYIYEDYRKRFGIETSYRLKNLCRIRTNNKNPVLRLLFVGISFLLVNIWVNLLWRRISRKRKGSRLIYRTLFVLKQMLAFLSQALQRKYQVIESILGVSKDLGVLSLILKSNNVVKNTIVHMFAHQGLVQR